MPAKSIKHQRFFGMVRAAQKGEGAASPEVAKAASSISKKGAKDFASTKHKGLPMKKEEFVSEEGADRLKDRRMERGGMDGNTRYPTKPTSSAPQSAEDREAKMKKHREASQKALDMVRASIIAKHGAGSLLPNKKKNESYVPGKPAEKLGAVTAIPKDEQDAARERLLKKAAEKRASLKKEETEKDPFGRPGGKYGGVKKGGGYDKGYQAMQKKLKELDKKEEVIHEDEYRKMMAQERKAEKDKEASRAGRKSITPGKLAASTGRDYADSNVKFHAKVTGKKTTTEEVVSEAGDYWHPDPEKDRRISGAGNKLRAREDQATAKVKEDPKKLRPGESYMDYAKRQGGSTTTTAKPKETFGDKIKRKLGSAVDRVAGMKEGTITYREFVAEGNRTGRMMQKSKTQVTGHISADRGDDEKANRGKRKDLEKDLKKHGIGHKKGVGEYKYGSGETGREVSYQTSKPEKMSKRRFGKVMRRMGRKHGQESVITKDADKSAKLHYTEKGSKAKSDSIGKTKAGKHPEGYGETSGTKVRSGKLPKKTTKGAYHYG
jgi:hypothetical protein